MARLLHASWQYSMMKLRRIDEGGFMRFRSIRTRAMAPAAGVAALLALLMGPGCAGRDPLPPEDPNMPKIEIHSSAFTDGGMIPKTFTCDGPNHSPPLAWSRIPNWRGRSC